jgi:hypothetical protein
MQRGYTLADVSIHGLYQGGPLHEDEDSDSVVEDGDSVKLTLMGKLKGHKEPERV